MGAPPRLASGMLVSALMRRVQAEGGFATVVHRGDDQAGAILIECADHGRRQLLIERATGQDGRETWRSVETGADATPEEAQSYAERMARRRRSDPDLWVIELDIADAERFAAEILLMD